MAGRDGSKQAATARNAATFDDCNNCRRDVDDDDDDNSLESVVVVIDIADDATCRVGEGVTEKAFVGAKLGTEVQTMRTNPASESFHILMYTASC